MISRLANFKYMDLNKNETIFNIRVFVVFNVIVCVPFIKE